MTQEGAPFIYSKRGRPACVVFAGGRWWCGEVRARRLAPDGWRAEVAYYVDSRTAFLREFPVTQVRTLAESSDSDWELTSPATPV